MLLSVKPENNWINSAIFLRFLILCRRYLRKGKLCRKSENFRRGNDYFNFTLLIFLKTKQRLSA